MTSSKTEDLFFEVSNACDKWELLQRVDSGEATSYERTAAASQALTHAGIARGVVDLLVEVTKRAVACDDATLGPVVERCVTAVVLKLHTYSL